MTKIPESVKEAIEMLDVLLNKSDKAEIEYIKEMLDVREMIVYHSFTGRSIRNNWGLWKENPNALKINLLNLGCGHHPDDMSMFLLELFYYHIHNPNDSIENVINEYVIKRTLE